MSFFKNIEELSEVIPIFNTTKLKDVSTDLFVTEERYLVPILGRDFYTSLHTTYNSGTPSGDEVDLIKLIQRMVGSMAAPLLIPKQNTQVKSSGVSQNHGEGFKPAFQWSVEDLKRTHWTVGYNCMEALYDYLERFKASFSTWVSGEGYSEIYSLMIWNTFQFQKYVDIKTSRRVFIALKPHLLAAQEELSNTTSQAIMDAALATIPALSTPIYKNLAPYIQRAMAHRAMEKALSSLALTIDGNGVSVYDNSATSLELNNLKNANDTRIAAKVEFHQKEANSAIETLRAYLIENKASYPLFTSSSAYDADYSTNSINDTDRPIISL